MVIAINIFYVDADAHVAAKSLVDKHVVKMILESAQLLSTAHRILDGVEYKGPSVSGKRMMKRWRLLDSRDNVLYHATHINHPSAIWCRESIQNYNWLFEHLMGLCEEYTARYNKTHKVYGEMTALLASPPFNLKQYDFTEPPCAMPKEYIISTDPIVNYRNYYINGKSHLHSWKRNQPNWIKT